MKRVVFYDGQCGLCDRVVQFLLKADPKGLFLFAPLQGETAEKKLQQLPKEIRTADTLILIENYDSPEEVVYIYGKAAFKILWALGGFWAIPGLLSFLPGFMYDWIYRLVARNRKRLFGEACMIPPSEEKNRFLP